MKAESASPEIHLRLIRVMSWLVPNDARRDWRREWEAEVISRWLLLEKWDGLSSQNKLDLLKRIQGAFLDALSFQQARMRLVMVMLNLLVAALTGFGALQELIVRGILERQTQPLLLSLAAALVSVLFMVSGVAMWRHWHAARQLIIATGVLSIVLHIYGALPPHRNIGYFALLVGAGYGLFMLLAFEWQRRRNLLA